MVIFQDWEIGWCKYAWGMLSWKFPLLYQDLTDRKVYLLSQIFKGNNQAALKLTRRTKRVKREEIWRRNFCEEDFFGVGVQGGRVGVLSPSSQGFWLGPKKLDMYLLEFGGTVKWDPNPAWEILWAKKCHCDDGGSKGEVTVLGCLYSQFVGGKRYMGVSHVSKVGHCRRTMFSIEGPAEENCLGVLRIPSEKLYGMDSWKTQSWRGNSNRMFSFWHKSCSGGASHESLL